MPGEPPRAPPGPRPGPAPERGPEAPRPRRGLGLGCARRGADFRVRGLRAGMDAGRGPRVERPRVTPARSAAGGGNRRDQQGPRKAAGCGAGPPVPTENTDGAPRGPLALTMRSPSRRRQFSINTSCMSSSHRQQFCTTCYKATDTLV
ncbi:taperin-like [Molothrus ater]|uniref:taperin-like n=1 Tax=Molothrus ater TaxID=84834 RepID=UPI0023E8EB02|nr:taperin-like [Molothrus ater]